MRSPDARDAREPNSKRNERRVTGTTARTLPLPLFRCNGSMAILFLVLLFVGSGAAALIYEVVWQQLLQLVIGSSTVSLGVLLGTFMGGMCLGSLLAPRLSSPTQHPLRVYALLESAIGAMGLVAAVRDAAGQRASTRRWAATAPAGVLLRGARRRRSACCRRRLLMGATLPAVARWVERTPRGSSWLGLFYAGNIAGAVLGCLLAGFYLLRVYDMAVTTYVAVAINAVRRGGSAGLASRTHGLARRR